MSVHRILCIEYHRIFCRVMSGKLAIEGIRTMEAALETVNCKLEDENSSRGTRDIEEKRVHLGEHWLKQRFYRKGKARIDVGKGIWN